MTEYERVVKKMEGCVVECKSCNSSGYQSEGLGGAHRCYICGGAGQRVDTARLLSLEHPNGEPMLLVGAQDQSRPELSAKGSWSDLWHGGYEMCQQDMSDFRRTLKGETG